VLADARRAYTAPHAEDDDVTERLVDAAAVAERLGVPTSWVREQVRAGAIPHLRLGRYVRFDLDDVDRWLEGSKQPGRTATFRRVNPNGRG
jgi:excisionase family DNA binding protein